MCSVGMQGVQQEGASTSPPEALSGDGARVRPPSLAWLTPPASHRVYRATHAERSVLPLHSTQPLGERESRDPSAAVRAWRAVYPYEGHQHTAMEANGGAALLVVRVNVQARGGGAERLHASCCHFAAVPEVQEGERMHAANC
jgi:hypothetical protein